MQYLKKISYLLPVILLLFISIASDAQIFKSKQTMRHKKMIDDTAKIRATRGTPIEYLVSVQAPNESSPKPPKTFMDLAPEVQKELIKRISYLEDTGAALMDELKKNFSNKAAADGKDAIEIVDMTEQKRQIIVGVFNRSLYPGDRIYRVDVTVKTDSTDVYFTSCDAVITKYETLEIAKQTQSSTLGFEANGNAGSNVVTKTGDNSTNSTGTEQNAITGDEKNGSSSKNTLSNVTGTSRGRESTTGLGANAKFNASRSRTQEGTLRQRYVALSGNILRRGVKLYTESISGIDLTGNIIAEVSFRFTNTGSDFIYSFDSLFRNDTAVTADKIRVSKKFVIYPTLSGDITMGDIKVNAVLRAVTRRENTIMEGDDRVAMLEYKDLVPAEYPVLVTKNEVVPKVWRIQGSGTVLNIRNNSNTTGSFGGTLYFGSVHEVRTFIEWLKANKADLVNKNGVIRNGKYQLMIADRTTSIGTFIDNCKDIFGF